MSAFQKLQQIQMRRTKKCHCFAKIVTPDAIPAVTMHVKTIVIIVVVVVTVYVMIHAAITAKINAWNTAQMHVPRVVGPAVK